MILPSLNTNGDKVIDCRLHDLLGALGFTARERVSINTHLPGERFVSTMCEVADLEGWSPPQDRDVWFGVNPVARHLRYGRGREADIARVRTLFADLDVKPGRQFDAIWQCQDATRLLRERLGVWPVALVRSGHGLQPYWRVGSARGDSNVIDRDRSLEEFKSLYQRWGSMVKSAARKATGEPTRSIDNVFELSRVLRCPGSVNWKDPDNPVPVRTELFDCAGKIRVRDLLRDMDADKVELLAPMRAPAARVATSWVEADAWIAGQPGAGLDLAELLKRPRRGVLWEYLDPNKLVAMLDHPDGAHKAMTGKVLHAVLSAQEGRAGLVVALNHLQDAYLSLMEARARGEISGEARPTATAADDVYRAVVGAVARARGRALPNVDTWGPRIQTTPIRRYWPRRPRQPRTARFA